MRYDIRQLQNGSDIIGIATEGVPGEDITLTQNNAGAIGTAFMVWLASKIDKPIFTLKICVGSDSRLSSKEMKEGIMMGVQMTGSRSYDAGLATAQAMQMAPLMPAYEFDGAVMVSAGDEPFNRNGFKFYTQDGPVDEETIKWILDKAFKYAFIGEWFECEPVNLMQMYAAHLRGLISAGLGGGNNNLAGKHIIVDASNGAAGFFVTEVLEKLGADTSGSLNLGPDGNFPGHQPDPDDEQAKEALGQKVLSTGADLGLIFNSDASRLIAIGPDGRLLGSDWIAEHCVIEDETDSEGTELAAQIVVASVR